MFTTFFITLALAAFAAAVPARRAPAQVVTKCTVPNTAALTFDDGPYVYLYDVSKALIAAGAKGTFFFNGNNFGCIYSEDNAKRVKYAFDKGHQVASHTWSHANLTNLTWDQNHDEFWRVEEALLKMTGAYPAYTRPPYGAYNDLVREVATNRGQTLVNWDFDSGDSIGKTAEESNKLYDDIAAAHPSTILALNHEVHQQTAQVVVPHAIKTLQKAGYKLVTLAECLGQQPYLSVGAPSTRDATWKC
jgi:peptidoglycan/xylan/chitin deacetylase (PgdA/CDA1 family)